MEELRRVRLATKDPDNVFVGFIESIKGRFEFKNVSDLVQICEASVKNGDVQDITKFIVKKNLK